MGIKKNINSRKFLKGYEAANKIITKMLTVAELRKPKRLTKNYRKKSEFRQGYYEGLLFAYSAMALGEFPEYNEEEIKRIFNETI